MERTAAGDDWLVDPAFHLVQVLRPTSGRTLVCVAALTAEDGATLPTLRLATRPSWA